MDTKKVVRNYAGTVSGEARYCPDSGNWMCWSDSWWKRDVGEVMSVTLALKHTDGDIPASTVREILWILEHTPEMCVPLSKWDSHPFLMACEGVTVDLSTSEGLRPRPEWFLTKCCPVTPAASSTPVWDSFFSWFNNHDIPRMEAMMRLLGYFLTGSIREQKIYFLHGPGRNGKTVLLELVKHLMGDHAVSASPLLLVKDAQGNRHLTELMTLCGARLGIMSELAPGSKLDVARMKYLTGGDTICARGMRQDEVNFTNTCKLIAAVNDLPEIEIGAGVAEKRRVVIIPCPNIVPEEDIDPDLLDKLKAEAPGILAKIIAGAKRYLEGGIQWTQDVTDATSEMWADGNHLEEFITEEAVLGLELRVGKNEFYQRYAGHCFNAGMEKPSSQLVSRSMKKLGYKDMMSNGKRYWRNISLKSLDSGEGGW